jgi:hypothetical protein
MKMGMLKPDLKLKSISDDKSKEMQAAADEVNRQRKSGIDMPKVIEAKEKRGYR